MHAIQHARDEGAQELARRCGLQVSRFRYILDRLRDHNFLQPFVFLDGCRLGKIEHALFFSTASISTEVRANLLQTLIGDKRVVYVSETGGEYQYITGVLSEHPRDIENFLEDISAKFGQIFNQKALAIRSNLVQFGRKWLAPDRPLPKEFSFGLVKEKAKLDDRDLDLLRALVRHPEDSYRDLGKRIEMPHSTVEYRIQCLRKLGVLQGYGFKPDLNRLHVASHRYLLSMRGLGIDVRSRLVEFARAHPNIVALIQCLGSWDYELVTETQSPEHILGITQQLCSRFGDEMASYRVLPTFRSQKHYQHID